MIQTMLKPVTQVRAGETIVSPDGEAWEVVYVCTDEIGTVLRYRDNFTERYENDANVTVAIPFYPHNGREAG